MDDMSDPRQLAHELVDRLPEAQLTGQSPLPPAAEKASALSAPFGRGPVNG